MNINPLNSSNLSRVEPGGIENGQAKKAGTSNQGAPAESSQEKGIQAASNPIQELPEIREEVVQQAIAKLNSGFYQTRDAAIQTARAILGQ